MQPRYFDDFRVGDRFASRGLTLTESAIIDFAWRYDPQPFHLDAHAAADSPFGGLIASGFQTIAVTFRLFYQQGLIAQCSLGSPGIDELRWLLPVRPGDTLRVETEVLETRPSSSKPDRGLLRMAYRTLNQHGETVMSMTAMHLLQRGPAAQ